MLDFLYLHGMNI